MAQDAVNRWWWPSIDDVRPARTPSRPHSAQSMAWGIKRFSNDELRQRFVDMVGAAGQGARPRRCPIPSSRWNEERGHYDFGHTDFEEFAPRRQR